MKKMSEKEEHLNPKSARFREADWYKPGIEVIVGGAGGIGSYLSFFLGRQEARIYLFDFDSIEVHNQGGQLYRNQDLDKKKNVAIKEIIQEFSGNPNVFLFEKYDLDSPTLPFMFSAFDNMTARKIMFENWKKLETRELFIDGRMNAEQGQIYFVTKGKEEEYEKTLFDDSEVEELPCNYKATSHCGAMIASLMVSGFNNYIGNKNTDMTMRELPFHVHYLLQLFDFKIY